MNRDIIEFDVIGGFTVGFFRLPCHEVIGLSDGLGLGLVMIIGHFDSPEL